MKNCEPRPVGYPDGPMVYQWAEGPVVGSAHAAMSRPFWLTALVFRRLKGSLSMGGHASYPTREAALSALAEALATP